MASDATHKLMERLDAFSSFTDEPGRLTRLYLTPAHRAACAQLVAWMRAANLEPLIDAAGNIRARYEGRTPGAPALMIGSHIDTVRDAGRYDGNLGALAALALIEAFSAGGERFDFAIEIVAFGDEEGVRFPTTMTGSRAMAGRLAPDVLARKDAAGVSIGEALTAFGCDPALLPKARLENVLAFVELHIEQGPALEAAGHALGVVTAINGATRLNCVVRGQAGHAGAVPMSLRHDGLAAAAEMILAIEARANSEEDLVATVGEIDARPGAVNVIAGRARFSVDIRSPNDASRRRAVDDIVEALGVIATRRGVEADVTKTHDANAYVCDARIVAELEAAMAAAGEPPFHLPSGAGHDAMMIGEVAPAGMLFVRCKGGVSHSPLEAITVEDCEAGLSVLMHFVRRFRRG